MPSVCTRCALTCGVLSLISTSTFAVFRQHRVVLLVSVPGSVVSRPLVWRGSLHPDHLEIPGVEEGSYWKGIAFANNTSFLQ